MTLGKTIDRNLGFESTCEIGPGRDLPVAPVSDPEAYRYRGKQFQRQRQ